MNQTFSRILAPKTGLAVEVRRGDHLRVTDLHGKQVVDMAVFNLDNLREKLSTTYTRARNTLLVDGEYVARDHVTTGDSLMSTIARPMLAILEETPEPKGVHDTHARMCNRTLYEMHGVDSRDGCLEIISSAVEPYGLLAEDLPDTFDIFMNYYHDCDQRRWFIGEPVTKPGDYIEFRAEMDVLVGLSNCPMDVLSPCNGWHCTPVQVEVFAG